MDVIEAINPSEKFQFDCDQKKFIEKYYQSDMASVFAS